MPNGRHGYQLAGRGVATIATVNVMVADTDVDSEKSHWDDDNFNLLIGLTHLSASRLKCPNDYAPLSACCFSHGGFLTDTPKDTVVMARMRQLKHHAREYVAINALAPRLHKAVSKLYKDGRLTARHARWLLTRMSSDGYGGYPRLKFSTTMHSHDVTINGNLKFSNFATLWFDAPYWGENPFTVGLFSLLARENQWIFDVGANVGLFAFLAATASETARVHAFEPHPELAELLSENVAANDWSGRITVWPVAVSGERGTATFYVTKVAQEGTLMAQRPQVQGNVLLGTVEVETVRLDDMLATIRPDLSASLFKVDVEGAEGLVLAGSTNILRSGGPRDLIIELLRDTLEDHQLDPLLQAGMRCFKIGERELIQVESSDKALALYAPGDYNFYCTRRSLTSVENLAVLLHGTVR
jgi:FkbM family methyltransferase